MIQPVLTKDESCTYTVRFLTSFLSLAPCSVLKYNFLTSGYLNSDMILVPFFKKLKYKQTQLTWLSQFVCIVVTPVDLLQKNFKF